MFITKENKIFEGGGGWWWWGQRGRGYLFHQGAGGFYVRLIAMETYSTCDFLAGSRPLSLPLQLPMNI